MPEAWGPGKGVKLQPSSPHKVQAHMLQTSQRISDSDEELVYERANFVLALEDPPSEPIKLEKS